MKVKLILSSNFIVLSMIVASGEADHISGALFTAFVSSFSRDCVNITTLPDELIEEDEYFFAMITFDGEIFGNVLMTRSEGRTRVTILDDDGEGVCVCVCVCVCVYVCVCAHVHVPMCWHGYVYICAQSTQSFEPAQHYLVFNS